ncbi:murein biosynthesis integral membrane protein MurJ [Piscibacillus salipiscarius]|uniref:Probable lipid II flippase MurJ n=1 Tax=Piscibacillus salipiscarius TaxID=299480 RepID=A0ABW5QBJ6_9BACI|nr:murein biosynthesis integral membrane protein MurJ [Piscibacillus salipiscarius]
MLKRQTFFRAFSIIAILTIGSKLLGFVREAIIASYFGTSIASDMFYVALIIPTIAFTVIGTAIQGYLLPVYMEVKENQKDHKVFTQYSHLILLFSFMLMLLLMVFAKPIVMLMAPGFSDEQFDITSLLVFVMLPILLIMTINSLTQVVFHTNEHFTPPALGAVLNNFITIIFILILYPFIELYSLATAVLLGSMAQLGYQYHLSSERFLFKGFQLKESLTYLKSLKPILPIIIAAIALQLNLVVDRIVASFLEPGGIAALNYSYRLLWIPLSILLIPISTIYYPKLSRLIKMNELEEYGSYLYSGFKVIVLLSIPLLIVMCFESNNLVNLVYERGAFGQDATNRTAGAFYFYSLGLVFFGTREYFVQHFYANKAYKQVMLGSIIGVFFNILLSILLAYYFGINGVALATSSSMLIQSVFFYIYIRRSYCTFDLSLLVRASITLSIIAFMLWFFMPYYSNGYTFLSITITSLITFITFYIVHRKEITLMVRYLKGT